MEHSSGDGWYLFIGAISPWAAQAVGLMVTSDMAVTVLMSAVGATTAWVVKALLDYIKSKVKRGK